MRTAFSTLGCPDWLWSDVLRHGPEFGYDGVELRLLARETDLLKVPDFQPSLLVNRRSELASAGFAICGLSSSVRFDSPDESVRREQVDIGRRHLDLALGLGAEFIRVFGDRLPQGIVASQLPEALRRIAEPLQRLGEFAESAGATIVIETHGDFAETQLMRQLMAHVPSPAVGILWDTHHPWRFYGETFPQTLANLSPRIRHTHWKDSVTRPARQRTTEQQEAEARAHSLMSGHRPADYVLFGGGEFPALECLQALRRTGYDGWCSLEWEKFWHPEIESPEVALRLFPAKFRALWELAGDALAPSGH